MWSHPGPVCIWSTRAHSPLSQTQDHWGGSPPLGAALTQESGKHGWRIEALYFVVLLLLLLLLSLTVICLAPLSHAAQPHSFAHSVAFTQSITHTAQTSMVPAQLSRAHGLAADDGATHGESHLPIQIDISCHMRLKAYSVLPFTSITMIWGCTHAGGQHEQEPVLPVCVNHSSRAANTLFGCTPSVIHCVVSELPLLTVIHQAYIPTCTYLPVHIFIIPVHTYLLTHKHD